MELNSIGIVELAAIVGTCVAALATLVFMKDKSMRDELAEQRRWTQTEIMALSNACVKREELNSRLTTMEANIGHVRDDMVEIRSILHRKFDKDGKKS